ncbi:MAG: cupin domain-containing protein [Acidimicrobiia bacterium]|nr:cupin domain-containing protein [Acidimicrobiia bacterium]MYE67431.1 cupin domain-containing protein [Acidimicrobiia bacterium]MYJ13751.1 cupin domain-containing protein [Acidimicrobiia bacterium]
MDLSRQTVFFLDDEAFVETARPGFRRRVITGDGLQLCFWRIAGGTPGSYLHNHPDHEQLGIVVRGGLDFRIGDESRPPEPDERVVLGPGDSYLAYRGVWHGDSVFVGDEEHDECWILDVFAPPRQDLLQADAAATWAVTEPSTDG